MAVAARSGSSTPSAAAETLLNLIQNALDDLKAQDISIIPLAGKASFADYLVVATGTSGRHVASLADTVAKAMAKKGLSAPAIEGKHGGEWVCIDATDVVVHIFQPAARQLYQLEKLWSFPSTT